MKNVRLLIFAGGSSPEHTISLLSTKSLLEALSGSHIEADVIIITKQGRWLDRETSRQNLTAQQIVTGGSLPMQQAHVLHEYDCVMSLIHGPTGEDGCIQGLFEIADVPYLGANVLSSAICMDKATAKDVAQAAGIPQVPYLTFHAAQFAAAAHACLEQITAKLRAPWFVKPSASGSSIGISRVTQAEQLLSAIQQALAIDRTVVIEQGLLQPRELEIAVLGADTPQVSVVGEIRYDGAFYDYEAKYTAGRSSMHIPADIPSSISQTMTDLARSVYTVFRLRGFARLDFLLDSQTQAVYLSEINTLPGFTPFSMFPLLWQKSNLPYVPMIAKLIELAQAEHQRQQQLRRVGLGG